MTDAELLRRYARDRDAEALAEIVRRHGGMVLGVARRVTRDAALARSTAGPTGETPLNRAPSVAMAELVLAAGADPDAVDNLYHSRPVRWEVSDWRDDVAHLLEMVAGPDDDLADDVAAGHADSAAWRLAAEPGLVNGFVDTGALGRKTTYLHLAAQTGRTEVVRLLLAAGATVEPLNRVDE